MSYEIESRPLRARELKLKDMFSQLSDPLSRPLRARELKHIYSSCIMTTTGRAPCGRVN